MNNLPLLLRVFIEETKKSNFIFKSLLLSLSYLILAFVFLNFKTYVSILSQSYSLPVKAAISYILFIGTFSILGLRDSVLVIIISILFGINLEIVLRKLKFLKKRGNLHITIGAGIVSLVTTGCTICGLSLASVIGLAGIVALIPFHGLPLYIFSILILFLSLIYNLKSLIQSCKIEQK